MEDLTCDEFLDKRLQELAECLEENVFRFENEHDAKVKEFEKYTKALLRAAKTNNYGPVNKYLSSAGFREIFGTDSENCCPNVGKYNDTQSEVDSLHLQNVKMEKLSISGEKTQPADNDLSNMPAPKMPPPKSKRVKKEKISNVVKVKQEPASKTEPSKGRVTRSRMDRASDVILQDPVVPVVNLCDSLEETEEVPVRSTRTRTKKKEEEAPIRSTRTRTKKIAESKGDENVVETSTRTTRTKTRTKRDRSESEKVTREHKKSKSDSTAEDEPEANVSAHTEYEDALSHLENRPNATFVIPAGNNLEKQQPSSTMMNATIVIEKSKFPPVDADPLLTDDESMEAQVHTNPKSKSKQAPNQVFSPYENSPVKKKVEAFEKFQKNENKISKLNTSKILREIEGNKGNVKEKVKGFVGANSSSITNKVNPPSASKIGKYIGNKSLLNSSPAVNKWTTPKSGHDFKERELKRLEREKEHKKKELLKQSMTDERKKRYEEKVMRVHQQQKEAMEKEKEKAREIQRIKEERYKLVQQQKEEKQRLLKEENERKRIQAKQRAEEKRKEEEAALRLASHKKDNKNRSRNVASTSNGDSIPIYLLKPTPELPCHDCYDSDDERSNRTKTIPEWASKNRLVKQDRQQNGLGHKIKNTFFCCQSQNIDLRDVFQRIDPAKLKRSSSAYWEKPPRFTLLPTMLEGD